MGFIFTKLTQNSLKSSIIECRENFDAFGIHKSLCHFSDTERSYSQRHTFLKYIQKHFIQKMFYFKTDYFFMKFIR